MTSLLEVKDRPLSQHELALQHLLRTHKGQPHNQHANASKCTCVSSNLIKGEVVGTVAGMGHLNTPVSIAFETDYL